MSVPTHLTDVSALFLMSVWSVIWFFFVLLGQGASRRFPINSRLVRYSSAVFITITLFYWIAFSGVGLPLDLFEKGTALTQLLSNDVLRIFGALLVLSGAGIMVSARWGLRELTLTEMIFSICEFRRKTGLYRYITHPMYLGMFLVLIGSLVLYPSVLGALLILLAQLFIEKKKQIE